MCPSSGRRFSAPVHELVLDEEHRPLVLHRVGEERTEVVALARRDDADVGDAEQELLERLAVRRPVAATAAHRRAHDERHRHLVVVHLAELRDPVDDLVEAERDEVTEHDLEDRSLPAERHPGGDAERDASLIGVVITRSGYASLRPLRHLERAAVRIEDVLAEEVDVVPRREDLVQRLVQHLDATLLGSPHATSPPSRWRRLVPCGSEPQGITAVHRHGDLRGFMPPPVSPRERLRPCQPFRRAAAHTAPRSPAAHRQQAERRRPSTDRACDARRSRQDRAGRRTSSAG